MLGGLDRPGPGVGCRVHTMAPLPLFHGSFIPRFDHRDTGRSDRVDFDIDPYAVAVLDGLGTGTAHLVGASLGGVICQ